MKQTINLLKQEFESATRATPEWIKFCQVFRKELATDLKKYYKIIDYKFSRGHFYCSCFFKLPDEKCYYVSMSDVRHFPGNPLLIRTAKNLEDYTGGSNNYLPFSVDMFKDYELPK